MRSVKNSRASASAGNRRLAIVLLLPALAGCTSATLDKEADGLFRSGKYEEAGTRYHAGAQKQGDDGKNLLLWLLEEGLAYHLAGKYVESNRAFSRADQVAVIKDYTSISQEVATLITSENIKSYKGEEFEHVLISTYMAMNYALLGEFEDAQVEARRVNSKLYRLINEAKRKYQESAFAQYLSGVLYETGRDWSNAYVSYKKTHALRPDYRAACLDLWRLAGVQGMPDEQERWQSECALTDTDFKQAKRLAPKSGLGEIVVIYQNGIAPIKRPSPAWSAIPEFVPRANPVIQAQVKVTSPSGESPPVVTEMLENIEAVAIENLRQKYAGIIAKKVAGVVAKEVVANQIDKRTGNKGWGDLARLAMYISDQADLRSWNLLPHDLQIVRIPVEPGPQTVVLTPIGGGAPMQKTVAVAKGSKAFVTFRYLP